MAKKMLKCKKDMFLTNDPNYRAFTEGKLYRPYTYTLRDGWDIRKVLCVKNDHDERHIIKDRVKIPDDSFFHEIFEEVTI